MEIEENKITPFRGPDLLEFELGFITALITIQPPLKAPQITCLLNDVKYSKTIRSAETIKRAIRKIKEKSNFGDNRANCGREKKVGIETRKKFVLEVEKKCDISTTDLSKMEINYKNVCEATIANLLHEEGFVSRIKPSKIALSEINKIKRFSFAREHLHFQWEQVLFSDESPLHPKKCGKAFYGMKKDEKPPLNPNLITKKEKQIKRKVKVGGCISPEGPVAISWLHVNLNAQVYISEILEKVVKNITFLKNGGIFQQDNAPEHKTKAVLEGFTQQQLSLFPDWPPQSPDISPIENVGSFVKDFLNKNTEKDAKEESMGIKIQECWGSDELKTFVKACYASLPKRIEELLKNEGGGINY